MRRTTTRRMWLSLLLGLLLGTTVALSAQDPLSAQVLRLLTRDNSWSGANTYSAGITLADGAPAVTTAKLYQTGNNLFWNGSLVTTAAGVGTVTSVGLSAPAIFSVAGSPVTGTGTLAMTLATQVANRVWAGPAAGADATPTFRALVAADIPADAAIAGAGNVTWASVSKTGSALADLTTRSASDLNSGTLPDARFPSTLPALSGVNLTALNATNLGSGAVPAARMPALTGDVTSTVGTVATTLAVTGVTAGAYGGANNLLSMTVDAKGRITALANVAAGTHNLLSATHTDTLVNTVIRGAVIVGNSTPQWTMATPTAAGQVLRYDGLDAGWSTDGSLLTALSATAMTSGTLAITRGGTGITAAAANGQLLIGTGTGFALAAITGTANQVVVTNASGTITLSTPQGIGTTSTPQFARIGVGTGAGAQAGLTFGAAGLVNTPVDNGNCGAADTIDFSVGSWHIVTLSAATCTLTFNNPVTGSEYWLLITQDGAGSRLVTWPTIRWSGGAAPTLTTGATKVDIVACRYNGTSYFCRTEANY